MAVPATFVLAMARARVTARVPVMVLAPAMARVRATATARVRAGDDPAPVTRKAENEKAPAGRPAGAFFIGVSSGQPRIVPGAEANELRVADSAAADPVCAQRANAPAPVPEPAIGSPADKARRHHSDANRDFRDHLKSH